jgi:hypothetical protein
MVLGSLLVWIRVMEMEWSGQENIDESFLMYRIWGKQRKRGIKAE